MVEKIVPLFPVTTPLVVTGKVHYFESTQSKSMLLLKKPIRDMFPRLKDKHANINYALQFFGNHWQSLISHLKKIQKNGEVVPLLLTFVEVTP